MRVTAACPDGLRYRGNHLAMALAQSEADGSTYGGLSWQDGDGNRYAMASFVARPEWFSAAQGTLSRPDWDTGEVIDMDAASAAQALMEFWTPDMPGFPPSARPDRIIAVGGISDREARASMGLTPGPQPVDINHADSETLQSLDGVGASLAEAIIAGRPWVDPKDLSRISGISDAMVAAWLVAPGLVVGEVD